MAERIYNRGANGDLEPLQEEPFSTENELQLLIGHHPELLDGEQIRPGDPRRWILITREKGIAQTPESAHWWSLDHLIVDQDAVPTLVEVKRGSSPEIRRTIVGQMLEYAAHASQTWTADELRSTFEQSAQSRGVAPSVELAVLLQSEGEADEDTFWQKVATNLAAKRLRLLFVADEIPDSLERVVEFLNAQMPNIEVLAVEIKQFRGKSSQTLVPRVLGRTAASSGPHGSVPRQRLTRDTFLDEFTSEESRNASARLFDAARESGAVFEGGPKGFSVRGICSRWQQPITVAWFYSPSMNGRGWMRTKYFTFGVAILDYEPGPDDELRRILRQYADSFREDSIARDASSKGVIAWSVGYDDAAQHIDLLCGRLSGVLSELRSL